MLSVFIFVPVAAIAVVFLIIAVARAGNKESGGGEEMIKKVYLYLVLFTTLMMVIGGSVAAFMALADIVAPTPHYQSLEEFKRYNAKAMPEGEVEEVVLSEEELQIRYDEMITADSLRQTARAKNSLIKSLGWVIIPLPIFIFAQRRLAKREEE